MRILFCQLRNHGDIIRTFPLIDAIKMSHPDWFIGFTCYKEMVETCLLSENIDIVISQPRFSPVTDTQGGTRILDCTVFTEAVGKVKQQDFDLYVDLHGVFQSAVFGAMCNIRHRLGRSKETAKDGVVLFYTDICEIKDRENNRMERHFKVFNELFPEVKPMIKKTDYINDTITIFPGSSKMGMLKRWEIEYYAKVANDFCKEHRVKFVLGPEDIDIGDYLSKNTDCEILILNSWKKIFNEIIDSRVVIGNDSAYIHMAVWKSIPSIMICGPTSAIINGIWKYGPGKAVVSKNECKCPDVWKGNCNNDHKCMKNVTVIDVELAVLEFL